MIITRVLTSKRSAPVSFLRAFPVIGIPIIIYNILLLFPGSLNADLFSLPLLSTSMPVTVGVLLTLIGIFALFVEVLTSVSTTTTSIWNHGFSVVILVICAAEFLAISGCGTPTFLYLSLFQAVDVLAGFAISIRAAQRDLNLDV